MRAPETFDVTEYAEIAAALADADRDRAATLAARGLDEPAWAALDHRFQEAMSRAMDSDDGVPPVVAAYAEAFARARAALVRPEQVISIERFADATREIQRGGDPEAALTRLGITLREFIRANEHWTRSIVTDPALFARYRSRLG